MEMWQESGRKQINQYRTGAHTDQPPGAQNTVIHTAYSLNGAAVTTRVEGR